MTDPLADDDPITLANACELFPQAKLTLSTLRAEASRGRLEVFMIGRRSIRRRDQCARWSADAAKAPPAAIGPR